MHIPIVSVCMCIIAKSVPCILYVFNIYKSIFCVSQQSSSSKIVQKLNNLHGILERYDNKKPPKYIQILSIHGNCSYASYCFCSLIVNKKLYF